MSEAIVTKKGAKRVRGGHLWIYKSDVVRINAGGGDVVRVLDEARNFVGNAFYSDTSEISLRIFSTKPETIDEDFWRNRLRGAFARRARVKKRTNAYRLVNSESDLMPSLIVDRYDEVIVMQNLSQGTERLKSLFAQIIREELSPKAIIERNDVRVRERENLPQQTGVLYGEDPGEIIIDMTAAKMFANPLGGQKTGSFLDQRDNHFHVRSYAWGRALDCFTFNGGFALSLAVICPEVTALDISEDAIELAKRNANLNNAGNVTFKVANVFDALREMEAAGERFDTIVLDPPAFVKSRAALKSAIRGYKEINLRALKLLSQDGILITWSCSYHFTEDIFLATIEEAARDAKRRVQLLEKLGQPEDHPVLIGMPESHYLKGFVLKVID